MKVVVASVRLSINLESTMTSIEDRREPCLSCHNEVNFCKSGNAEILKWPLFAYKDKHLEKNVKRLFVG